jgi:glycerol-3-phosphate dehydrogenase (NAD+)
MDMGSNTKAAIIRIGMQEMVKFAQLFFPSVSPSTMFESCGVADLITTCFGGRNRKVAEAFARTGKGWEALEGELLGGQKLQGTLTAAEVHKILTKLDRAREFPFFEAVHAIAFDGVPVEQLVKMQLHVPKSHHVTTGH